MKPEIKYENGMLVARAVAGVDTDKDGEMSAGAEVKLFIDAKEAFAEIIKQEIPQWMKDLLAKKQEASE